MIGVTHVILPDPPIGSKIACFRKFGIYVLERGPGLWRALSCTHAGSGVVSIYDGIPDEQGFFEEENLTAENPRYGQENGRVIHYANPSIMGMWMYDGGFQHGLTMKIAGQHEAVAPVVTLTWIPFKPSVRKPKPEAEQCTTKSGSSPIGSSK